jgi:hypothetical protein
MIQLYHLTYNIDIAAAPAIAATTTNAAAAMNHFNNNNTNNNVTVNVCYTTTSTMTIATGFTSPVSTSVHFFIHSTPHAMMIHPLSFL